MWRGSVTLPAVGPLSSSSDSGSTYGFAAAYLLMDPARLMGTAERIDKCGSAHGGMNVTAGHVRQLSGTERAR
ncbi:hypothetical protein SSPO_097670 [Streptomyces antimycoticus]|uniref:Uncharacterized protein n=1 Tax=Streptomyces antimycoticus TaxID=68175 RepID=A0A499VDM3_9ACTN|nr:hypothetical protein SSPO_097670 [Streptomyces antimycoticus]